MKIIDLSHQISDGMATYPSDPDVIITKGKDISTDRTLQHSFTMGTHTGTHLDVPAHILNRGKTLSNYSLSHFHGRTIRINDQTIDELGRFEAEIDGVIYDTEWYRRYDDPDQYFGSGRPAIPVELVDKVIGMGLKYFGCDLPSVDASGIKEKPIHLALLGADIIIYESLTNLGKLPLLTPFDFYGFPLALKNLDGCPVRAVGIIGE
jgi:arylformamidase